MDHQVVSSVWKYGPEYDLYIAKFLELLLKYEYVWCEQDERDLQISLPDHERRLFADDFREFQKGLTSFDMAFQMKKIRKVYKQELIQLEKAGKSENDSKLPWFSEAHRLFSDKTDKEKEILRHENSSTSSDISVTTNGNALTNFQEKSRKSPSLRPTQVPSSSKTAMVTLMPTMNSVSTITTSSLLHSVNPILMADFKPYTVRPPLTTMADFSSVNPVVKTTNCLASKSCLRTISKISILSSPYKMTANSSLIRHPFSPPTSISPVSRIPLRLPTTSSTNGAPLLPATAISAARSPLPPVVKPSTYGAALSSSAMSSRLRISLSRTISSRSSVLTPIATPWKTRVPPPAKTLISRSKGPNFMNTQSSRVELPLKSHRLPTSYSKRVSVSLAASSSKIRVPQINIAPSSSSGVSTSTAPTSSGSVLTTSAPSSRDDIPASDALTSKEGFLMPCRSPPSYRQGVPPSSVAPSPRIRVPALQIAVSSSPSIFTQTDLSSSPGVFTSAAPSSRAVVHTSASDGVLTPSAPSSKDNVLTLDALSSNYEVLTLDASSSNDEVLTLYASSSNEEVLTLDASSSNEEVLTLDASSSNDEVPTLNALPPTDGHSLMPYRSLPPYRPGVLISTAALSSTAKCFSPSTGVLEPVASFSSTGLPLSPTTPYSSTRILPPTALSSKTRLPFSPTASGSNTGVRLSPTLATSPTGICVPEIAPLKYPFSPSKVAYF